MISDFANRFAQKHTSAYEQFLAACQNEVLVLKASGAKPTPKAIRRAKTVFNRGADNLYFTMVDEIEGLYREAFAEMDEEDMQTCMHLFMPLVDEYFRSIAACLEANEGTFMSAMKFGHAFHGLSDLLGNMHGSMGYLVQQKAQEMKWNVRTKDGKTMSATRFFYTLTRHVPYIIWTVLMLIREKKYGDTATIIDKEYKQILKGNPEKFLNKETLDKYFHVNAENNVI